MSMPRIYLDNAATSWPKPPETAQAMLRALVELGAPAGRGGYAEAEETSRTLQALRSETAGLLNTKADRVVFTHNGTDGLNLVLHGWLTSDDVLVTTAADHNSVLRPAETLRARGADVGIVPVDACGRVDPVDVETALAAAADRRPRARKLLAFTHASNVTGAVQPLAELVPLAQRYGFRILLDAAQTLGSYPLDLARTPVDFLAAPGHKGLLGPLGTGILVFAPGTEREVHPLRQGGTGSRSESLGVSEELPDRFEAGNLNVPGLFGLEAAVRWVRERTPEAIHAAEAGLIARLERFVGELPGFTLFGGPAGLPRVGVSSLAFVGLPPQELAAILDAEFRVQCRAGLHCAPLVHPALGTAESGGTLRLSVGPFTTEAEVAAACAALESIARTEW